MTERRKPQEPPRQDWVDGQQPLPGTEALEPARATIVHVAEDGTATLDRDLPGIGKTIKPDVMQHIAAPGDTVTVFPRPRVVVESAALLGGILLKMLERGYGLRTFPDGEVRLELRDARASLTPSEADAIRRLP